jgi:hypothetical protein
MRCNIGLNKTKNMFDKVYPNIGIWISCEQIVTACKLQWSDQIDTF